MSRVMRSTPFPFVAAAVLLGIAGGYLAAAPQASGAPAADNSVVGRLAALEQRATVQTATIAALEQTVAGQAAAIAAQGKATTALEQRVAALEAAVQVCCNPVDKDGDGWAEGQDCDDTNAAVNPGAKEIFDKLDNNCDGIIDNVGIEPKPLDRDFDGWPEGKDCDDADATVFPGAKEIPDGKDNDCDGNIDEMF